MSRSIKLAIFGAVALVQLAAPAWMIGQREWVLRHGTVYKFRTAPVDPYDAFRGRYIWLNFEETSAPWTGPGSIPFNSNGSDVISGGPWVYATLVNGSDGFAHFSGAGLSRPKSENYLYTKSIYAWGDRIPITRQPDHLTIVLPFDRYYMNEAMAPAAEQAYIANSRRANQNTYATVRVWRGQAVLEGVYIGDQRIEDYIRHNGDAH
jgi:uncharacterized membrane-anchored protein